MQFAIVGILMFCNAFAADLNGYTAKYECRAGNLNCDVNVEELAAKACEQIITPLTTPTGDWSVVNQSLDVICLEPGNYKGRGILELTASGNNGARKVVRLSGSVITPPVSLARSSRATISGIVIIGDYWLIHRVAVDSDCRLWVDHQSREELASPDRDHNTLECEREERDFKLIVIWFERCSQ